MNAFLQTASSALSNTDAARRRRLLDVLYRTHAASLIDFAARRLGDDDAAEDVVHDAFASIQEGRFPVPAVDVVRKLRAIVFHQCAKHRSSAGRDRATRARFRDARVRDEEAAWRSWRTALQRRGSREDDESDSNEMGER